jgi:ketosteroid isomerase-like protein
MSEENVALVRALFEAWNRRDFAWAQNAIDEQVEVESAQGTDMDGSFRGRDGFAESMQRFWTAFADFQSNIEDCLTSGDEVILHVSHHATGRASGAEVAMRNWQVLTVRDGKVVRYGIFATREQALEAAGLSE